MTDYKLPESFMEEFYPKDNNGFVGMMFGIDINELSREELIAIINFNGKQQREDRESHARSMSLMSDLSKAKPKSRWIF